MIAELGGEHVRQQAWSGEPPIDGAAGCRCLHDAVASGTAHPRAHMTDNLEAGREVLEHLGDIFTELLHSAAALRTALFTGDTSADFPSQISGHPPPLPPISA